MPSVGSRDGASDEMEKEQSCSGDSKDGLRSASPLLSILAPLEIC